LNSLYYLIGENDDVKFTRNFTRERPQIIIRLGLNTM